MPQFTIIPEFARSWKVIEFQRGPGLLEKFDLVLESPGKNISSANRPCYPHKCLVSKFSLPQYRDVNTLYHDPGTFDWLKCRKLCKLTPMFCMFWKTKTWKSLQHTSLLRLNLLAEESPCVPRVQDWQHIIQHVLIVIGFRFDFVWWISKRYDAEHFTFWTFN